jgi:hypothetical protein
MTTVSKGAQNADQEKAADKKAAAREARRWLVRHMMADSKC